MEVSRDSLIRFAVSTKRPVGCAVVCRNVWGLLSQKVLAVLEAHPCSPQPAIPRHLLTHKSRCPITRSVYGTRSGSLGALDLSAIDITDPTYALRETERRIKVEHLPYRKQRGYPSNNCLIGLLVK